MKQKQAEVFYESEGDAWLKRNLAKLDPNDDLVLETIGELIGDIGRSVLEIGCSNGWRLAELQKRYKCITQICGIDPSGKAIRAAEKNGVEVYRGTAQMLPWIDSDFEVVICGFMFYVIDRKDLFKVVKEVDRVLRNKGLLIIFDFAVPQYPYREKYKHKSGIWSYHQDYSRLFTANPAYKELHTKLSVEKCQRVVILRKDLEDGWLEQILEEQSSCE